MQIELVIEALIVDGLPVEDEATFVATVEAELGRLLATQGLPAAWQATRAIDAVHAGTIQVDDASSLGGQVAQAVVTGGVT